MSQLLRESTATVCKQSIFKSTRIYIDFIYRNEAAVKELTRYMASFKGVNYIKANPLTGSILILFDEGVTNERNIEKQIYQYYISTRECSTSKVININSTKCDIEAALPIAADEILPHQHITNSKLAKSYHSMSCSDVEAVLGTNPKLGLNDLLVQQRTKDFGLNIISDKKRKSILAKLFENLNDFSAKLLSGVGIASFLLGQIADGIAILGIVAFETILATIQQQKSEKSLYSLKNMMVHRARVIRNGRQQIIDSKYLVPGDLIIVEAGEKIPADARIIESADIMVSEALLTGESAPVYKSMELCDINTEIANMHNMIFMGTNVLSGRGRAIVTETGINTQIGRIAQMLQNIKAEPTPLENKIKNFTEKFTKISFVFCLGISSIGLLSGASLVSVLMMGISFAIGAIPESLPAVVSTSMALSVQKMAARNAIVRKLPAVETLGSANVICCDKTGTLTMNEMTVRKIYADSNTYRVSGLGYNPKGEITLAEGSPDKKTALNEVLKAGIVCNNSSLILCDGKWSVQGDPTEGALIAAAYKNNMDVEQIKESSTRTEEIPFDSSRRFMTVVVSEGENSYAYCKGSVSRIMDKCKKIYTDGEERLFTATDKERLQKIADAMGSEALRVLAFAYKQVDKRSNNFDNNYIFLGIVGMEDPPREGVMASIQKCNNAGIKVVMITGDNKNTASAIGRELGLLTDGLVISGSELDRMDDDELCSIINSIQVFARTSPEQKYRIVKAFKKIGNVVAMTGDGVNDAPAIKEADIGIAMGRNGSDVAKDAADITLADDNFSTIVAAIEEGRAVSNNIRNSMRYLLAGSFGEILSIFLASAICGIPPLLSIQILWINVISETIMGASLVVEPPGENVMDNPPADKDAPLFDRKLKNQIIRRGFGIGLTSFGLFQGALVLGYGINKARTLAFTNLILSQLANVYDCRSNKKTLSNKYMNIAGVTSTVLLGGILYYPPLNAFFGTVPLNPLDIAAVYGATRISRI